MKWTRRPGARAGFTLIELMVMITIFTALLTVSAPPVMNYLRSNQLDVAADRLAADLQFARAISIANSTVLRFQTTADGYQIVDPVGGAVLRDRDFNGDCAIALAVTTDFFPWGMANAVTINMSSCAGTRTIDVLPTGIVEVSE